MKRIITITDLSDLKDTFVILYEGEKAIDYGIITEVQESQGLIIFKSSAKKDEEPTPLMWYDEYDAWAPAFEEPMTGGMVFSKKGVCYSLRENERRMPVVLS